MLVTRSSFTWPLFCSFLAFFGHLFHHFYTFDSHPLIPPSLPLISWVHIFLIFPSRQYFRFLSTFSKCNLLSHFSLNKIPKLGINITSLQGVQNPHQKKKKIKKEKNLDPFFCFIPPPLSLCIILSDKFELYFP